MINNGLPPSNQRLLLPVVESPKGPIKKLNCLSPGPG